MGNIKFDQSFPDVTPDATRQLAEYLGLRGEASVLIAGSTHSGEEEVLIDLHTHLTQEHPSLVLILAPRHLHRLQEVERVLEKRGVPYVKKSALTTNQSSRPHQSQSRIILLDTLGELMKLYSLGTVVFIGGSLVPVGGHNPLEPLSFRKCVLFGPHMFNFHEIAHLLIEGKGAIQVQGKDDLFRLLQHLFKDQAERTAFGERGYRILQQHQGTTERIFAEIKPFLDETVALFKRAGLSTAIVSGGGTGHEAISKEIGCTETRSGSYAYEGMKRISREKNPPNPESCAVRVICTVVSVPTKGRVIIDGGMESWTVAEELGRAKASLIISVRVMAPPPETPDGPPGSSEKVALILKQVRRRSSQASYA